MPQTRQGRDDRERMLRIARFALHVITVVLTVVTVSRAAIADIPLLWVTLAASAFLGWYGAGAALRPGAPARGWLLGLTAVWGAMLVLSAEFVWLAFPLLLLAGHVLSVRWSWAYAVVVLGASILAPLGHRAPTSFAHIIGPLVGGGFALAISLGYDALLRDAAERNLLITSLMTTQQEMAALQEELAITQRETGASMERTRLSRDLHDTIAQDLSSMALLARTGDVHRMPQIEDLAQHSLRDLRRIVAALAPAELEESALSAALGRLLQALRADTGADVAFEAAPDLPALPTPVEVVFLRVAQSAFANIRQHAEAHRVHVSLGRHGDTVTLTVSDDGAGFDPAIVGAGRAASGSYGIAAMSARLRELGGELRIDSAPGHGTTLAASVRLSAGGTP